MSLPTQHESLVTNLLAYGATKAASKASRLLVTATLSVCVILSAMLLRPFGLLALTTGYVVIATNIMLLVRVITLHLIFEPSTKLVTL